jgi:alkylation response protein AidB-like acyl-CoA dehydrogenase
VSGDVDWVAVKLAAPTIEQWGTDDQKARFLPGIRDGRTHWCQLFSEPGAGSDLAGLATRAVRDGESWVVSGQKVWTSLADTSDYGLLLARTDPDQPKHRGITYFIVDLRSDGVDVRPLRQMTGEVRFSEVFLSDVLIPDDMRLGPVNDGWRVSLSTLASERAELSSRRRDDTGRTLPLITQAKASGTWADPVVRNRLMGLYSRERALELTNMRAQARLAAGAPPGPEGSVGKLLRSELSQSIARVAVDLRGAAGIAWAEGDEATAAVVREFLYSPAHTIAGGTSQVQRNIIGERVLGLPREPGSDKDMAWKDIPRQ